jgi:hypothetical protein
MVAESTVTTHRPLYVATRSLRSVASPHLLVMQRPGPTPRRGQGAGPVSEMAKDAMLPDSAICVCRKQRAGHSACLASRCSML